MEFELRQGIKFHNGEEFDADSVVYTLNSDLKARRLTGYVEVTFEGDPTSRSSGGRSAVRTISGTRASYASTTAGSRFAAAVPEVQVTATGSPLAFAMPSAMKPAARSSTTDTASIRGDR